MPKQKPKHKRPHCSELPDVKPVKTEISLFRNYLMQEDDSSTVEEGFTIVAGNVCAPTDPEFILATNNRGTVLTKKEYEEDNWFVTDECIVDRIRDEMGDCPAVDAVMFLLRQYEKTRAKLDGLYYEVEELVNCDILTNECDLAKNLRKYKP